MRILGLLVGLLFLPSTLFAQIDVKASYSLHEPIVLNVNVPKAGADTKLTTIWELSAGSWREFNNSVAVWGPEGRYQVSCTTLQTKTVTLEGQQFDVLVPNSFNRYRAEFTIGTVPPGPNPPGPNPPGPNPPPNPTIPDDRFDNIGKRLDSWINAIPDANAKTKRFAMGVIYNTCAKKMETAEFKTISESNAYISAEIPKLITPEVQTHWNDVASKLKDDLSKRTLANRMDLMDYYRAISVGMLGGK